VDPLTGEMPDHGAYNYTFQNPIMYNDPTGMKGEGVDEPPVNGLPYYSDDTGHYYWDKESKSYDHYDNKLDYQGEYKLPIAETNEPVGNHHISLFDYNSGASIENDPYDSSNTPTAAEVYKYKLENLGNLKDISNESRYPGVKIYSSPDTEGGVTLGNMIFVNSNYLKRSSMKNGRNSLLEHEYGHYLDYKFHFKYNFTSYIYQVGIPSIGSAAGLGRYSHDHSKNPVERKADILSEAFFNNRY